MTGRAEKLGDGQLVGSALLEGAQRGGGVVDLIGVDDVIVIGVERLDDGGRWRWRGRAAAWTVAAAGLIAAGSLRECGASGSAKGQGQKPGAFG